MTLDWWHALQALGACREHEPMARHTTLAVGGASRWFFRPDSRETLISAMQLIPLSVPLLPLGRGSNLLIPDAGFSGVVVDVSGLNAIAVNGQSLNAACGVRMSRVARQCAEHGLSGLEFMATVPGDVGGGVAMNAGAFGQQVSDCLTAIELVTRQGEVQSMDANLLEMSYRHTLLPTGALVLAAHFSLQQNDAEAIRGRMREMRAKRGDTQPLEMPNCGSVFKNPQGDHAARLIEAAGLKGLRIGGARISDKHANFIVNEGGAKSSDVLALIRQAKETVEQRFGVRLEPEVRALGETL
ncbi:MAG: UDP-N-acetylmuramate dehydrogenase [Mariprofundaceae bacterium]